MENFIGAGRHKAALIIPDTELSNQQKHQAQLIALSIKHNLGMITLLEKSMKFSSIS